MIKRKRFFVVLLFSVLSSLFLLLQFFKRDDLRSPISPHIAQNLLFEFLNSSSFIKSTPNRNVSYAFVVFMKTRDNIAEYEFAQKTVKCYCESKKIPFYLIVNNEENVKGCTMEDYMYQRHCILANFMNTTEHEWFVMLDVDMGVINPDNFIPNNESMFLVLTNRVMNSEIMTGSYIVRNGPRGRDFLMMWAKSIEVYRDRFGSDNAAVHNQYPLPRQSRMDETIESSKQRRIAEGSFGAVFELIGHEPPAVLKLPHSYSPTEDQRKLFAKECEILKELEHPNIVKFFRLEKIDQKVGIIMEYCQNGNLKDVIFDPSVIYTMNTVAQWGEWLFDGLAYMYRERKIVHRDIKPENIFFTNEWTPKIGDFGLTKFIEATTTGTIIGTARYMSPKLLDASKAASEPKNAGQQHSHQNDVYSLGLTMWEAIERKSVFEEYFANSRFDYQSFWFDIFTKSLKEVKRPDCGEKISDIFGSCTNFNRLLRPEAQEVTANLRAIRENDVFIASLDYTPLKEMEQTELIRPIGFNGTRERSSLNDHGSTLRKGNDFEEDPFMKRREEFRSGAARTKFMRDVLKRSLDKMEPEKKRDFILKKIPRIITEKTENDRHVDDWKNDFVNALEKRQDLYNRSKEKDFCLESIENISELFSFCILSEIDSLIKLLEKTLGEFWSESRRPRYSFFPWTWRQWFSVPLSELEFFLRSSYINNIFVDVYISLRSGDEVFKFGSLPKFYPKNFNGRKKYCEVEKKDERYCMCGTKGLNYTPCDGKDCAEIRFSHQESIIFSDLFRLIEERFKSIERRNQDFMDHLVPIDEANKNKLPEIPSEVWLLLSEDDFDDEGIYIEPGIYTIPNYLFQIRNPPRRTCEHQPKCSLGPDPYKKTTIDLYKCQADEADGYNSYYLRRYSEFLLHLDYELLSSWKNFSVVDFLPVLVFLNCPWESEPSGFLILLDHPNNYQESEMIPCFTTEMDVKMLKVCDVRQRFNEISPEDRTYTLWYRTSSGFLSAIKSIFRDIVANDNRELESKMEKGSQIWKTFKKDFDDFNLIYKSFPVPKPRFKLCHSLDDGDDRPTVHGTIMIKLLNSELIPINNELIDLKDRVQAPIQLKFIMENRKKRKASF